jgi:hypothetical protein
LFVYDSNNIKALNFLMVVFLMRNSARITIVPFGQSS